MQGFTRKLVTKITRRQGGFTLVEMLVVVGIIVALAAVIIPSVARFIGAGDRGAQKGEIEIVQTAMYSMADKAITTVTANTNAVNNFSSEPQGTGADPLANFLTDASTAFYYCWASDGKIIGGWVASGANCTTGTPDFTRQD